MRFSDISELAAAVRAAYGCEPRHLQSCRVRERFAERIAWQGIVEVFELVDCPEARQCYAWSSREDGRVRITTVLKAPPVDSPEAAVRAIVAAHPRSRRGRVQL
jgi:hypothetical protein